MALKVPDSVEQFFRGKFGQQHEEPQREPDVPAPKNRSLGPVLTLTALAGLAAGAAWFLVDKTTNALPVLRPASASVKSAAAATSNTAPTRTASPDSPLDIRSLVKDAAIRIDAPTTQRPPFADSRTEASGANAAAREAPASDQPAAAAKDLAAETAASPLPTATVREAFQHAIPKVSPPAAEEISSLIERSRLLISQGNIAGARRVLERAASVRSGEALLRLAKTYDPVVLARWRALGVKADPEKAQELYRRAAELGASNAPETTTSLAQAAPMGSRR
jgi:hypothetical protein